MGEIDMKETINDELKIKDIDTIEKISGESLDIVKENVKKLKEIFPEVFNISIFSTKLQYSLYILM